MFNRIIFVLLFIFCPMIACGQDAIAKVIKVIGTATAVNASNEVRKLERGTDVSVQETIVTGEDGAVTLRFTDGSLIDVAASSKYIVHDYHFKENDAKKDKFASEIIAGGFRAITGTIGARNPTDFTAKANLTTLAVRGTLFYLICEGAGCENVLQFTLEGTTMVNYAGKEYLTGPNQAQSTFMVSLGKVNLSKTVPTQLPVKYNGNAAEFKAAAAAASPTETSVKGKAQGAGTGSDPCKVLKDVGAAVK